MRARPFVLACAAAGSLACAAPAAADIQSEPGLPDVDARSGRLAPTAGQRAGVRDLGAEVAWNEFGTPSSLVRTGGALGAADGTTAADAARAWVERNRALFRLTSTSGLELIGDAGLARSESHAVTFRQTVGGLPASGGGTLTVGLARAGGAWSVVSATSDVSGDETLGGAAGAQLNAAQAWQRAAASVGQRRSVAQIARARGRAARAARGWTALRVAGLGDVQRSRQVAFPTPERGYVRAVESLVVDTAGAEPAAYRVIADAASGAVLLRESLVDNEAAGEPQARAAQAPPPPPSPFLARWAAFPANPPLAQLTQDPWNNPSTDTRERWCWRPSAPDCDRVVANLASRSPWDFDPRTNQPTFTTSGNNARSAEGWASANGPVAGGFQPTSLARDYTFPWTNEWFAKDCDPSGGFVPGQSFDISAATTNLFVQHNRMHDWSYVLGFTEQNFNGQLSNFGLTEPARENDPVLGDAQAGAALPPPGVYTNARNNANMATLPDGTSSITNMYLWQPVAGAFYPPCVDGDYDAAVISHEYGHMIENRMIGKGNRRSGFQAGAMGEAAGDLFAVEQLNENGFVPTSDENPFATGTYVTGNKRVGIRNYAPNWPQAGAFPAPGVFPDVDPLNFGDIGYDTPGPEVHSDGEIWVAINFEVRRALAAKYNGQFPESDRALQARCAAGEVPVDQCPGNRRWMQLLFDAFLLMPTNPTMVDARNAILAADQARFGGADVADLWAAFARRGLGRFASQTINSGRDRGAESDTDPLPDFEAVGAGNATVTFRASSTDISTGAPVARVYVGHYEARVSPIADTDPGTAAPPGSTADNLDETAVFAPGTYEFIATAPRFGAVRFRRTLRAGLSQTVELQMAPNLASAAAGAQASGDVAAVTSPDTIPAGGVVQTDAEVLGNLIDDTEATDWQAAASGTGAVDGRQVTVDLAGTGAQTVRRVQVSALIGPVFDPSAPPTRPDILQNRFTSLRQFEIWACNAGRADCTQDAGFTRAFASGPDAFPAVAPRPTAPTMILRSFAIPAVQATHLRLVVRATQCTGGPAFQGEQDADPNNATDCDTAGPETTRFVRVAELQAFSRSSAVR